MANKSLIWREETTLSREEYEARVSQVERQAAAGLALAEAVLNTPGRYETIPADGKTYGPPSWEDWDKLVKLAHKEADHDKP
jgi:hypothetical protein